MKTSESKLSPSSLHICSTRVLMISSESGLNLNLAHLEARGSMILHHFVKKKWKFEDIKTKTKKKEKEKEKDEVENNTNLLM